MIRRRAGLALIAFAAALCGALVAHFLIPDPAKPSVDIHAVLHERLKLDAAQAKKLEVLERDFAEQRRSLEARMRADNRLLAAAIQAEHHNGPAVEAAIDATHMTMGELQKATVAHVFAMRALLREDQVGVFDEAVTKALVEAPQ